MSSPDPQGSAARQTSRVWRCMGCGTVYGHDETHRCSNGGQWAALVLVVLVVFAFVWIGVMV